MDPVRRPFRKWLLVGGLLAVLVVWKPVLVQTSIFSDTVRGQLLGIEGSVGLKTDIAWAARDIPSVTGYGIGRDCYRSLLRDYESGTKVPDRKYAAAAFRSTYLCYITLESTPETYDADRARFKRVFGSLFGHSPFPEDW